MSFDDLLADCNDAFMDAFGESTQILYRPNGGTPRSIAAIIDRPSPELLKAKERPSTHTLIISVANDPVKGIDITTFDPNVDRVDVPIVLGGPLQTRTFSSDKAKHDGGMVTLKVT